MSGAANFAQRFRHDAHETKFEKNRKNWNLYYFTSNTRKLSASLTTNKQKIFEKELYMEKSNQSRNTNKNNERKEERAREPQ